MKMIINADDFGYSEGINYGIIDAHKNGILTSTTLMMNMNGTEHAVKLAKENPKLGIGLHFNISLGKPLTKGESLINEKGNLIKPSQILGDKYRYEDILEELEEQLKLFIKLLEKKPTHFDSHLFSSDVIPTMRKASIQMSKKYNIPLRNYDLEGYSHVEFLCHRSFNSKPGLEYVIENFEEIIKNDIVEIMSHPGYIDLDVYKNSSYCIERVKELEILKGITIKKLIKENNVRLINYSDINKN